MSAVVGSDLRVTVEPSVIEPRAALDQMLAPLGLVTTHGPGGSILIVPRTLQGNLSGRVLSASKRTPVVGATVRIHGAGAVTVTDANGHFEISLDEGSYEVTVHALGFVVATVSDARVTAGTAADLEIELQAHPAFVTEVVVTPNRHSVVRQDPAASRVVTWSAP